MTIGVKVNVVFPQDDVKEEYIVASWGTDSSCNCCLAERDCMKQSSHCRVGTGVSSAYFKDLGFIDLPADAVCTRLSGSIPALSRRTALQNFLLLPVRKKLEK